MRPATLLGLTIWFAAPALAAAAIVNGDFSNGLTGWQTSGYVITTAGLGVVGDDGAARSILQQTAAMEAETYQLSFDVRNILSSNPGAGFVDTAFFSLYFTDTPGLLDVENNTGYTAVLSLFDLDSSGAYNVAAGGSFSASPLGANYRRFNIDFTTTSTHFAPVVDLLDLNFVDNDSLVVVDNFVFTAIPEPTSGGLAAAALLALCLPRTRRRSC